MLQEKEFYSKVCVAGSVKFVINKASKEEINISESDKFSCNLATILARDREVVAVNLKMLLNKCKIYISKNDKWLDKDVKYINEIKKLMTNLSKDAPMTFTQASERKDVITLFFNVLEYCSVKLGYRLDKLKRDIKNDKDKPYIKAFLEFAGINVDNLDKMDEYDISMICCEYYKKNKNSLTIPEKFLGHNKKVGSYAGSVMDIANCARKEKYKTSFSCIDLHLLDPIFADQSISSWNAIIKRFIPIQKDHEDFKEKYLKNYEIRDRLNHIYGGTGTQLDCEKTNHIYLHAELNILTNIMNQYKGNNEFIAVSKKCCYLCESYIEFVRSRGYKIAISGTHKKLYHRWKLPETFKKEFVEHTLFNLDLIIESGIEQHTNIIAKSDNDKDSVDSDNPDYVAMKSVTKRAKLIKQIDIFNNSDIQ
ncbi:hypothetical protein Glove_11g76 [Diversispora epigaea]|uniref:Uncharacterized protein n=1 Tax=Diversispora epigaea TaxID=1348612 RepID=A0A397JN27_9GLOM|nr:hypothetical protein Glove_11g76 [Diversispora epigaea]